MPHRLDQLMQTQMTRKQFLRTLGAGFVALLGLPALLHILDYQGSSSNQHAGGNDDYGISPYGGITARPDPHSFG